VAGRMRFEFRSRRRPGSISREVEEELRFHLDRRAAELSASGMSPGDAMRVARAEFGNVEKTSRYCRAQDRRRTQADRWRSRLDEARGHLTHGVRAVVRRPAFSLVAIVTVALAIGANTAVFSVANALLLAPLPYGQPGRLVAIYDNDTRQGTVRGDMSAADLLDYRAMQHSLAGIGFLANGVVILRDRTADPMALQAMRVSTNLFDLLDVTPERGRTFASADGSAGANHVLILSHTLWRRLYDADPDAVGRTVSVGDEPYTVVGVMPAGFSLGSGEECWLPLDLSPTLADSNRARKLHFLYAIARLRPGATLEDARTDLTDIARRLEAVYPDADTGHRVTVLSLVSAFAGDLTRPTFVMIAGAALVLLIACANLTNMTLARSMERRQEMAVRAAIGAGRQHLIRQVVAEHVVLGVAGGASGVAIAWLGVRALIGMAPHALPSMTHVVMDWRVLAFAGSVSIGVGLLIGLIPALRATRVDLQVALRASSRSAGGDRARPRLSRALVVTQVATAVVLLVIAGLLVRSLDAVQHADLGFRPDDVVTAQVVVRGPRYQTKAAFNQFYDAVFETLRRSRDVAAVGAVSGVPLIGSSGCGLAREDVPVSGDRQPDVRCMSARGDYFRAIGTPLLAGRVFGDTDRPDAEQVVVVNATMARRFWAGESPLGKRIRLGPDPSAPWETIVGIVGDIRQSSLEGDPVPTVFESDPQHAWGSLGLVVRVTGGDPFRVVSEMRAAVRVADPTVALGEPRAMAAVVDGSLEARRFSLTIIASFALLAVGLAALGVYGVLAYAVTMRTREFGIRLALGAGGRTILAAALHEAIAWTILGLVFGIGGALVCVRSVQAMLYGVRPEDPLTFGVAAGLLVLLVAGACAGPALRAMRADPIAALREQ
jgi:predicted permease